jgi:hypothetical protein
MAISAAGIRHPVLTKLVRDYWATVEQIYLYGQAAGFTNAAMQTLLTSQLGWLANTNTKAFGNSVHVAAAQGISSNNWS